MKLKDNLAKILIPILSILIAFIAGGIIILCLGKNPVEAYGYLFSGAFGSGRKMGQTLVIACPLIFTGLAAAFAYKCGVFNLGGEGQFIMGAVTSIFVSAKLGDAGMGGLLVSLLAGTVAGGIWGAIPGILKITRGLNEMIVSIMLNYVATLFMGYVYTTLLRDGSVPQTVAVADSMKIAGISKGFPAHWGVLAAFLLAAVLYYFIFYTSKGFKLRAVGMNATAAFFNGFPVNKYILFSFITSGAIAGLGGSIELHGKQFRLMSGFGSGFGFDGVAIALIAQLNPLGTAIVACIFAVLRKGASTKLCGGYHSGSGHYLCSSRNRIIKTSGDQAVPYKPWKEKGGAGLMASFFTMNFLTELLLSTVRMATPILLVALAETYSERAGMVNIGLDGIMAIGALVGFLVGYETGSPWAGVLAGALSGIATNMIYAFCTITLCAEQTVYGMAINIFAPALASFIYRLSFSDTSTLIQGVSMGIMPIPVLSKIPVIGSIFFQQSPLVYGAYLLVAVTAVFLNRTKAGLNFKAVGEFPKAAETLGINVVLQKYIACIICGALAGIGGAYLTICYTSTYSEGIVAGRGFIALSAVIFGRWMPTGVMFACLLFGFCDALQIRLQLLSPSTPYQILQMIPYLCTLFVLAFFGIKKSGPKANGQPYYREER